MRAVPAVLLLAAACGPPFPEGASALDAVPFAEVPQLAHVAAAYDGRVETMYELATAGGDLVVDDKPDPTVLLEEMNVLDDARPATGGTPLRLLTQNVGLLDAEIFWFFDYRQTPFLDERRGALIDVFLRDDPDVVFLQEVWEAEDVDRFVAGAEDAGYRAIVGERGGRNDGLLLLLKESLGDVVEQGVQAYEKQDGLEYFPGPGIQRGWQHVVVEHPDLGPLAFFNTHAQAFADQWPNRNHQARELGIAVDRAGADGALVFVGGDMNAGPYYANDVWSADYGPLWFENAIMYPLLLAYGGLVDAALMGRAARHAAADVAQADAFDCDLPHLTFTGTDCNSLYDQQYGGTEPPARLDHVLTRDPDGRVRATASSLVFTEREGFDGVDTEPSDHYGVLVDVVVDGRTQ